MKAILSRVWFIGVLVAGSHVVTNGTAEAALTTNNWNDGNSKWELGANWSAGVPSLANAINFVTGGIPFGSRVITIDVATISSNVINGCLTISNLVVGGTALAPDTLFLNNANNTPGNMGLTILNSLTISSHGGLSITNSRLKVGVQLLDDGFVQLNTGSVSLTNATTAIGNVGSGVLNILDGTWTSAGSAITDVGNFPGSVGTLTVSGGTATFFSSGIDIGIQLGSVGNVWLTGGQLVTTDMAAGYRGAGQMTVSNGTWLSSFAEVGFSFGSQGTLTIAGGNNVISQIIYVGTEAEATGTVWLTGGQLLITNNFAHIGEQGIGQMTVSNGTWLANNIHVGNAAGGVGTLNFAGGTTTFITSVLPSFPNFLIVGAQANSTGTVWMTGGQLTTTNCTAVVSSNGVGALTVSNGTWLARDVFVGYRPGSQGTLTVAGGTNLLSFILDIGLNANATGAVWMSGGELIVTNSGNGIAVGDSGVGQLTISNGVCQTPSVFVAYTSTAQGTLSVAGGSLIVGQQRLVVGNAPGATGTVWMTGGQLIATNSESEIGAAGVGRFTMSNGTWLAASVIVADFDNSEGTLSVGGGSASMTNLILGDCATDAEGFLIVKGGEVFVTNATHTAVLDVRNGWVIVTGGRLMVDKLVMTNDCGLIFHSGGTVVVGSLLLDPNLDADDDGLPNGWEQAHGLDPVSAIGNDGADGDPDHDGFSNLEEYEAGTDPQDPNSTPFHITSISQQGSDMLVTWTTTGGKSNVVQFTSGSADGSYSNTFTDLSPIIIPTGIGLTSTSYLDISGATNAPARYYRVRLVP